ncbi:DUF397 domain-containing protein [Nocardiopsis dassonvillei]|uniref:DUF397 domain-containing protein n=1 Tax=Nocardiopsis dassonvillei TaxID=2014 RepID=UPI00200E94BA|nr:DUF397 domain-containing protein [Nocardiopsis dassonvillei]MCK9868669.1 DUF397 domain-containing protein [Nocardiopsis dassonvillei]
MRSDWHKSSYSGNTGHCVEVSEGSETLVRDTQNRGDGHLGFNAQEWNALLTAMRVQ